MHIFRHFIFIFLNRKLKRVGVGKVTNSNNFEKKFFKEIIRKNVFFF
jgi:hypothetical protein